MKPNHLKNFNDAKLHNHKIQKNSRNKIDLWIDALWKRNAVFVPKKWPFKFIIFIWFLYGEILNLFLRIWVTFLYCCFVYFFFVILVVELLNYQVIDIIKFNNQVSKLLTNIKSNWIIEFSLRKSGVIFCLFMVGIWLKIK